MNPNPDAHYPTPAELEAGARALTASHPALTRLHRTGTSRAGHPLWLLSVGHGIRPPGGPGPRPDRTPRDVLVVAGAHANEPVGGPTALALAHRVLREEDLRADSVWHFLLCADPDGAALHRTPRPEGLLDYHRNFYRPPGPEQPEWAPSLVPPDRLPPESRALVDLIDEVRPLLQVSLHGTDLGGSWVQLTRDLPGLAEPFGKSAAELRIPLETSASDAAGWSSSGPGVFVMPGPAGTPAGSFHPEDPRLSTWYRAHRHGGTTAVVEVPMWASDLVDDPAPHPDPRAALAVLARRLEADAGAVAALLTEVRPDLPPAEGAPLLRAVEWTLTLVPRIVGAWSRSAPAEATAAYVGSLDAFGQRLVLRAAAMLLRELRAAGHPAAPALDRRVTGWCESFAARFGARWVPVDVQVEHQARAVVAAYERALAVSR
ncbi:M14 family zinc carboxypeptidase [Streptomyces sp. NPDC097619]|uniref:M14 family zinc carboxypeptidase n=1 Tax=Streptomyces sp. NPDC097619 TaxID=3157228 RepID=UPI0033232A17